MAQNFLDLSRQTKLFFMVLLFGLFCCSASFVFAKSSGDHITAKVSGTDLTVSGYIAPYASLALSVNGNIYRGGVADANGYFFLENIIIPQAAVWYCIDAVDVKRLGESYSCFALEPNHQKIIVKDLFLPPTIGVNHKEVHEGSDLLIYGYSRPQAQITLQGKDNEKISVDTNSSGYYEYTITNIKPGSYELFAAATYNAKVSAPPEKGVIFIALSHFQAFIKYMKSLLESVGRFLADPAVWVILMALFVGVGLLVRFYGRRIAVLLRLPRTRLHHAWFIGY